MDWKLGVVSLIKTTYRNYIYFHGEQNTKKFIHRGSDKKSQCWTWLQDIIRSSFQIIQVSKPYSWTWQYSDKKYGNLVAKNHLYPPKAIFLP